MVFAQNTAEGQKLLSQGIIAEQKGEKLTALDLYIQARTADKKNAEIQNHIDSVIEAIAKSSEPIQNFNKKSSADLKKSLKLRGEWDKIRISLEKLFEQYTDEKILKEYLVVYYPEIQTEELTSDNYSTGTINLSVKAPFLCNITSDEYQEYVYEREFAKRLKVILKTIDTNNEWKISLQTHRSKTYIESYIVSNYDLVLLKGNKTLSKEKFKFNYQIVFRNIPLNEADTDKITLAIQKSEWSESKSEVKILPFDKFKEKYESEFIAAEKRIKNTPAGETISIKLSGGFNEHFYPLSRLADAIRQCKGYVDLDISEVYLDTLGYGAELYYTGTYGIYEEKKTWGENGFKNCSALIRIVLPKSLKEMSYGAFMGCSSLREVVVQDELMCLGGGTFKGCDSLTEIFIPETVSALFHVCYRTPNYIEPGERKIFVDSFYNSSITEIYYEDSSSKWEKIETAYKAWAKEPYKDYTHSDNRIEIVYDYPAREFAEIKKEEAERIAAERIEWEKTAEEERIAWTKVLGNDVQYLKEKDLKDLGDELRGRQGPFVVDLSEETGLTKVGKDAFNGVPLQCIILPNGVTEIGDWAFQNCIYLESIVLPETIKNIGHFAFDGCISLKWIYYCGSKLQWADVNTGSYNEHLLNAEFRYESSVTGFREFLAHEKAEEEERMAQEKAAQERKQYLFAEYVRTETVPIEDAEKFIKSGNCNGTLKITGIPLAYEWEKVKPMLQDLGKPLTLDLSELNVRLRAFDFANFTSLENIILPNHLTEIDLGVFSGCTSLSSITISATLSEICSNAFDGCPRLKNVNYRGTKKQWKAIIIEKTGNEALLNAKINYEYKGE